MIACQRSLTCDYATNQSKHTHLPSHQPRKQNLTGDPTKQTCHRKDQRSLPCHILKHHASHLSGEAITIRSISTLTPSQSLQATLSPIHLSLTNQSKGTNQTHQDKSVNGKSSSLLTTGPPNGHIPTKQDQQPLLYRQRKQLASYILGITTTIGSSRHLTLC